MSSLSRAFLVLLTLAVPLTGARGDDVLSVAAQLAQQKLRYVYGSEDVSNGGLDCSGFTRTVFHAAASVDLPDEADKQFEFCRAHGQVWDSTSDWTPATLQPGDFVFFAGPKALPRESQISHVMLYCGNNRVVGAQGQGKQLDGAYGGVGYFHFYVKKPRGIIGESGERFIGHWSVFAYGRLDPNTLAHQTFPPIILQQAAALHPTTPLPEYAPHEVGAEIFSAFGLTPPGLNPRFD